MYGFLLVCFFFQAEDGIRDDLVTGVQTCALPISFMDDPQLKEQGKKWVRFFGCFGCHELSGLEDEGRIGTELTAEGSKPVERLDFALLTEVAERGGNEPIKDPEDLARLPEGPAKEPWYDHQGFFEHKLAEPNIWDQGKIFNDETEKLRMPNLHLTKEQIRALTTFLLGSQENPLPPSYQYKPLDYRKDIQEGWWVVKKYNCMGCHQLIPGQKTILMGLARYQDAQEQLPPKLLTEGARVDPQWLLRFLKNPALNDNDTNRNGIRSYLQVRMPTFSFSENELGKLVRFFQALSRQPFPYIPEEVPVLTAKETEMARSLFSSTAAPCLKCHATGDPAHDRFATAPNFLQARGRLKPDWMERWMLDPQAIAPGTSMPSGLFKRDNGHWVFSGPTPASFQGYDKDHTKLLVDYILQLTPEEQRRVGAAMGRSSAASGRSSGAKSSGNGGRGAPENVVASGGHLANVFVYVKEGLGNRTFDVPKEPITLDQSGCKYHPHVMGVVANQTIKIVNSDPTTHNIHPTPKDNREWNESQPPQAAALEKTFAREEIMLPVKCNQHPWMRMFVNVTKSPFFAVTGADGKFEIKGLPPGDYTIAFVQEKLGEQDVKVTLAAKDSKTVDATFKP